MRVLYFHQHFSTPKGSTGIRSYEMARRLLQRGHQVTMVCGSYSGGQTGLSSPFVRGRREGQVDGIDIIEFDLAYSNEDGFLKRAWTFLGFALRSIGLAMGRNYDLLFATTTPLTAGIPGIFARWLRGKPFVFEVRDLWPELPRAMGVISNPLILMLMSALEWASYRSAHRLIGLSPGIVDGIAKRGVDPDKIELVPNGCDLALFGEPSTPWRPDRVGKSDLMAVFTGTHGVANGLAAVLDGAAELQHRGREDIKLVLVGQGRLKAELQQSAAGLGLKNVVFHDPVDKTKLSGLMASADIGMQILANVPAFYFGTSPNKFFDYIAAGLPVLNNYPGWLAEIIEREGCGLVVPAQDAAAFADALEQVADNRELLEEMGARGRVLAEARFDRQDLSCQWAQWLELAAEQPLASTGCVKRLMDVLVAGVALVLLSPVLLLLAWLIRRNLGSPVLFSQARPGLNGKPFRMIKFRTMRDAVDSKGNLLPDDERMTLFGSKLRSASLDELPELWNVLKGEMSLVGPRPLLMEYLPLYSTEQARRHDVRPGITGWAQVNGRNAISWEQKFKLDVWYVDNRSVWLDLKILWLTVANVCKREGISQSGHVTAEKFTGSK